MLYSILSYIVSESLVRSTSCYHVVYVMQSHFKSYFGNAKAKLKLSLSLSQQWQQAALLLGGDGRQVP